jgi:condensation domain-containing protein
MKIVFTGGRGRTGPLTWGQRQVLRAAGTVAPQVRLLGVPDLPIPRVADAVARLVARHEALRTRRGGPDEQCVLESGTLTVELVRCAPGESGAAAEAVRERLTGPFDHAAEWPLRVALVASGEEVRHVVLVCSPLAVDHEGMELVVKDLALLLRGALPVRTGPQPVDDARQQRSEHGARMTGRAIRFWTEELARAEASPARAPGERFAVTLRSAALDTAAHAIAGRHGVSASTVYLAATAGLVGALAGGRVAALRTVVSNRFYPDRRDVVAAIAQDGVLSLDLTVPSFGDLVQLAWRETMRAHRFARYDPDLLADAVAAPFACFDDSRLARHDVPALPDQAALRSAAQRSALTRSHTRARDAFAVLVDGTGVTVRADGGLASPEELECWLRAFEGLLISAAYRDVATSELAALVAGATRPRA